MMFDKLASMEAKYTQLMNEMADPAVQADSAKFRAHSKQLAELQPLVDTYGEYQRVAAQIATMEDLLKDPDMRELAQQEASDLEQQRDSLIEQLKVLLIPKD